MLRGRSSLDSLFIALNNDAVAILYSWSRQSHFLVTHVFSSVAILPYCYTLYTSLRLIISKIVRAESPLSSLSPLYCGDIIALFYKKLDIDSRSVLV